MPAHLPWQACHRPAAGDQADAYFPLRQQRFFATRKAHVAGQGKLTSVPGGAPADQGDRHDGHPRYADKDVRPRLKSRRPLRHAGQILEVGVEVAVIQEKSINGTVEDQDLDLLVSLHGRHDLSKFANELWAHDIQWRIVDRDPPIGAR